MLGYRGHCEWEDLSNYVVHFTKDLGNNSAYDNLLSVLGNQKLLRGPDSFGIAKSSTKPVTGSQRSVCFSETPLGYLQRLVKRRSHHGIAFKKDFIAAKGACPVWYVDRATTTHSALQELIAITNDPKSNLWSLTPFIDSCGTDGSGPYRFEWEREWRLNADLDFAIADVAFLFIEEASHENARAFFDEAAAEGTGPCYQCPFIDPMWNVERMRNAMSA